MQRTSRSLVLTDAGQEFYKHTATLLESVGAAR
jgi:DNA-binding transcriptional LysR family regulator